MDHYDCLPANEAAFRRGLAACQKDMAEFDFLRQVFADWLEERGRADEALMTRAPWQRTRARASMVHWQVILPKGFDYRLSNKKINYIGRIGRRVNADFILHFRPGSLLWPREISLFMGSWHTDFMAFTHREKFSRMGPLDTKTFPGGFAGVFAEAERQRQRQYLSSGEPVPFDGGLF